jgi:hypothetical protein
MRCHLIVKEHRHLLTDFTRIVGAVACRLRGLSAVRAGTDSLPPMRLILSSGDVSLGKMLPTPRMPV